MIRAIVTEKGKPQGKGAFAIITTSTVRLLNASIRGHFGHKPAWVQQTNTPRRAWSYDPRKPRLKRI